MVCRLLDLSFSEGHSMLLRATLLRLLPGNQGLEALGECQDDQSNEVLDHLDDPSCWCPEFVFGIIDGASIAHEASRSR